MENIGDLQFLLNHDYGRKGQQFRAQARQKTANFQHLLAQTPDAVVQLTLILAPDVPQLSKREVVFGDLSFFWGLREESHGFRGLEGKTVGKIPKNVWKGFGFNGKSGMEIVKKIVNLKFWGGGVCWD